MQSKHRLMNATRLLKSVKTFLISNKKHLKAEISKQEYHQLFIKGKTKEEVKWLFELVWDSKIKEIDRYLNRSNYSWAFQVASFAAYFSVIASKAYLENPEILYVVICIGLTTSFAWQLINQGSKYWQQHWDTHINLIEEEFIGPLNKVLISSKKISIGNISDILSRFIIMIWLILGFKYFEDHITFRLSGQIDYVIWFASSTCLYFVVAMFRGYGRGDIPIELKFHKKYHT